MIKLLLLTIPAVLLFATPALADKYVLDPAIRR
jgi:hypothetical protein